MVERIKFLVEELNRHCNLYYVKDNPEISDQMYDKLYDELVELEKTTGIILTNSPTQKVQGECVDFLQKVRHNVPVLSSAKTKSIKEISNFLNGKPYMVSYKLDGLTIVLRYENGKLIQAVTRGSGEEGEDVTHNLKRCSNVPLTIPFQDFLEVRGECISSWDNFNRVNEDLEIPFTHPRNLASGSVRQLDSNAFVERGIKFIAFDMISSTSENSKSKSLDLLDNLGFETVERLYVIDGLETTLEKIFDRFKFENTPYPCDGIIVRFDDIAYSKSLGATSHHTNDMIAYKLADELYETVLQDIEWSVSRDGRLFPTAVFKPVVIDGATVGRATLHNIGYIKKLKLGIGDFLNVAKMNQIIPSVEENLTCSDLYKFPKYCPICKSPLYIKKEDKTDYLYCDNPYCEEQFIQFLVHAVSKKGLNIDGLSEAIIRVIYAQGLINNLKDIYTLFLHREKIENLEGLGKKSVKKLLSAIEKSKSITLDKFICALSIPNIGSVASKTIAKYFEYDKNKFFNEIVNTDFTKLCNFGCVLSNSMRDYFVNTTKYSAAEDLSNILEFKKIENKSVSENEFLDKTIVVTGSFDFFSRDSINDKLIELGAKPSGSISKKTDILIVGDKAGNKLIKARELGIKIILEKDFLNMI